MKENKNIDRLFQEKFKDFEITPDDAVWNRINESLPKKKKKRRVIALWWQVGGIAAAIALLLTVGISVYNSDSNNSDELPVVNTDQKETKSNINNSTKSKQDKLKVNDENNSSIANSKSDLEELSNSKDVINTQKESQKQNISTIPEYSNSQMEGVANNSKTKKSSSASQKRNKLPITTAKDNTDKVATQKTPNTIIKTENKAQLKSETERKSAIKKAISNSEKVVYEDNPSEKVNSESSINTTTKTENNDSENTLVKEAEKESIEDAIAENKESIDEEEKENEPSRWSVAPNVAPVYFNSLGNGSSLDEQFNDNNKGGDINMSYGIAGSYAISKKLKIRAGINRVNLNQSTSDVYAFTGAETAARGVEAEFSNIAFNGNQDHVSIMSSMMMNRSSVPEIFNTKTAGKIDQKFGFIEVPIELEYNLLDRKFGINLIGGFSTFILNNNEIYADVNGTSTLIGEANNINDTSFSANFGLGMDYNLSKQWSLNLEPTFKYQINTFNNTTGDFKPFFIGVYTGLSFKF
ncbi:hypothetical protein [Winogradskyella sp. 4-2091]|uniref:hypothetical protein n=1 Tax=Winogradskyella sp. 4-2091 TaxID=3381659 RepID=UPI003892203C